VLEIGAGTTPDERATETLDIREDLDGIDYPGVDIGRDRWPVETGAISLVVASHVLEHVPPDRLAHVFEEAARVLEPGGALHALVPHAGSWDAYTDPTHQGSGGWTPDVTGYFDGRLEPYFTQLEWRVYAEAQLEFPTVLRPSLRLSWTTTNGTLSTELVSLPFVTGVVEFRATVPDK
jgi:SAM-dependent methyltransferase